MKKQFNKTKKRAMYMLKNKKILVTGGAGFIGSNLVEKLLECANEGICLDNLPTGIMENTKNLELNPNFKFMQGDILNKELLNSVLEKINYIFFHYAVIVGVKRTLENPLEVIDVNIEEKINILELSFKHNIEKVIFASSSDVYGESVESSECENGHVNTKLPYAISELIDENYCEVYYDKHALKTTSSRFFNVYGPRQNSTPCGSVVGIFIEQALKNKTLTIFGDG